MDGKYINGSNKAYKICENGDIISLARKGKDGRILKEKKLKTFQFKGYEIANLYMARKRVHKRVHRLVAEHFLNDYSESKEVDHVDGNQCNNHVSNLRMCTRSQNQANVKSYEKSSSKYKGVSRCENGKWRARIGKGGVVYHIGTYATEELAAVGYDEKAVEMFGEFARCNCK